MSAVANALICAITLPLLARFFRKEGRWSLASGRKAFRYFTVQSNALCALGALFMLLAPGSGWSWRLKYVGTAGVTITLATVFLFLGPTLGYGKMLKGADFFMHLVTPLLALGSFCLAEKRGMDFTTALLGMVPVTLYSAYYACKLLLAPPQRRWEDFYGFNRGGFWPLSLAAVLLGSFGVCMGLMALQNL